MVCQMTGSAQEEGQAYPGYTSSGLDSILRGDVHRLYIVETAILWLLTHSW